jgi:hypothetical protein
MSNEPKREYQSTAAMPSLRPSIGLPPIKMVLSRDLRDAQADSADADAAASSQGVAGIQEIPEDVKERAVRRLIKHLKQES